MEKAYVEITGDTITAVDYYYGVRKEKQFRTCDIVSTEVISGYSLHVRGYRHSHMGICYRIFRGEKGRYLFKLIDIPESAACFQRYLERLATGNSRIALHRHTPLRDVVNAVPYEIPSGR